MRLTGDSLDIYKYIEPLYNDYRKIRKQNKEGGKITIQNLDILTLTTQNPPRGPFWEKFGAVGNWYFHFSNYG